MKPPQMKLGQVPRVHPASDYRPDIDGLRAVAVLAVLAFHLNLPWPKLFTPIAPGGFVGVDVFFVISGYLISNIIFREITQGSFSVARFYARRVKRIFPALYVIFAVCLAASVFIGFPSDAVRTASYILSSVFFVSNVVFYYSAGYFDQTAETNLVLHTWSLSVEEQFYVIFPMLA